MLPLRRNSVTVTAARTGFRQYLCSHYTDNYAKCADSRLGIYLDNSDITAFNQITYNSINAHLGKLKLSGKAPLTIRASLTAIRAFCEYLINENLLSDNPTKKIKPPRINLPPVVYYNQHELCEIITTAYDIDKRFGSLIEIIKFTGLRKSEARNLQWENIDLSARTITVCGKGGKYRKIPICKPLYEHLQTKLQKKGYLFLARHRNQTEPLSDSLIVYWWRKLKQRLPHVLTQRDIGVGCALHGIRSSFASEAASKLDTVAGLRLLQEWMGHADMKTLHRYIAASHGYDPAIERVFE
jgi:site-specific recombinase XerD